ncbi:hypothetical protein HZS_5963 [Henneguya salminicola]|nr:hypothetical protein HZS_5963 [Henneguya salminicola]
MALEIRVIRFLHDLYKPIIMDEFLNKNFPQNISEVKECLEKLINNKKILKRDVIGNTIIWYNYSMHTESHLKCKPSAIVGKSRSKFVSPLTARKKDQTSKDHKKLQLNNLALSYEYKNLHNKLKYTLLYV